MKKNCLLFLFIVIAAMSCKTTSITSSWKAVDLTPVTYKKILVIALSQPDNSLKENMEGHLVDDLKSHGVDAISAYQQYGPKAFDQLDEKAAIAKIQNTGVDAILTIVLLNKSKEHEYIRGRIIYTPYAMYYNRFWGYYNTIYSRVYSPGYYTTSTEYFWESNLYDATSKQLIYSVQTKSFNPDNSASLAHEYGRLIISNMIKETVIGE
ncbi:hypothetical protein FRZ67_18100 [Panacibacter ginsenosidivorans]|uniref:DUF4136 domain-containing protein n=1 Tax=Panacibacter ginsenosidivorans TaxID=1813871 RepID=A0A5B8VCU7_9BACT|nr:hypothetical protein [Panacibacter ginsenosidivorans]QEC69132.1 hypothetical protein FRZ67_18100 [Panacibacter ginsenosidivorans]